MCPAKMAIDLFKDPVYHAFRDSLTNPPKKAGVLRLLLLICRRSKSYHPDQKTLLFSLQLYDLYYCFNGYLIQTKE